MKLNQSYYFLFVKYLQAPFFSNRISEIWKEKYNKGKHNFILSNSIVLHNYYIINEQAIS